MDRRSLDCGARCNTAQNRQPVWHRRTPKGIRLLRIPRGFQEKRAKGFEPSTFSLEAGRYSAENTIKQGVSEQGNSAPSYSASYSTQNPTPVKPTCADIVAMVAACDELPAALRDGIIAMVKSASTRSLR